jgi:hypothetical protein
MGFSAEAQMDAVEDSKTLRACHRKFLNNRRICDSCRNANSTHAQATAIFARNSRNAGGSGACLHSRGQQPAERLYRRDRHRAAREPNFLAGVLEHILADENLLVAFAERAGIDPAEVDRARQAFGGVWERDLP